MTTQSDPIAGMSALVPEATAADHPLHISFAAVLENCARIGILTRVARPAESALLVSRLLLEADVLLNKGELNAYMMLVQVAKTMESADRRDAALRIDFEDRRKAL